MAICYKLLTGDIKHCVLGVFVIATSLYVWEDILVPSYWLRLKLPFVWNYELGPYAAFYATTIVDMKLCIVLIFFIYCLLAPVNQPFLKTLHFSYYLFYIYLAHVLHLNIF